MESKGQRQRRWPMAKAQVLNFEAPDKTRAIVTVHYNHTYLIVSLSAAPTPEGQPLRAAPTENQLIHLLPEGFSLQDLVCPITIHFRLETVEGKVQVSEIAPSQAAMVPKPPPVPKTPSTFKLDPGIILICASEIQVQRVVRYHGALCKVLVDGEVCLAKTYMIGYDDDTRIWKEMTKLARIRAAGDRFGISLHTSQISCYITEEATGAIIGYVGNWIESGSLGPTLAHVNLARMPISTRQKWADQIKDTMEDLHCLNLVWGDCKPVNVVLDKAQDTWLIDLGDCFTRGWVDPKLEGTLAGDEMGLANILKWLKVDS
ncbi:hypothetical protein PWT90_10989 [Aphanocladium album]|nr:hypothetical protein PWT90_10989 [Aphanocladium album]